MKMKFYLLFAFVGIFFVLQHAQAGQEDKSTTNVSSAMSLLLKINIPNFPSSLSGQPGEIKNITIPDEFEVTDDIQLLVNGKPEEPLHWNEFDRELSIMIPFLEPGMHSLIVKSKTNKSTSIDLLINRLKLPENITPDMVIDEIESNLLAILNNIMDPIFQNTAHRLNNLSILQKIISNIINNFKNLSKEDKFLLTALYYNSNFSQNIIKNIPKNKSKHSLNDNISYPLLKTCEDTIINPGCFNRLLDVKPTLCKCEEDDTYEVWNKRVDLIWYTKKALWDHLIAHNISKNLIDLEKERIKSCSIEDLSNMAFDRLRINYGVLIFYDLIQSVFKTTPINLKNITISFENFSNLKAGDSLNYDIKATFSPIDLPTNEDEFFSAIENTTNKYINTIENAIDCINDINPVTQFQRIIFDEEVLLLSEQSDFFAVSNPDYSSLDTIDMPPSSINVYSENKIIEKREFSCIDSKYGATLYANRSSAYLGKLLSSEKITFSYPNIYDEPVEANRYIPVVNRKPMVNPVSDELDPQEYMGKRYFLSIPYHDQECDYFSDVEVSGEPLYGEIDKIKYTGPGPFKGYDLFYTLTEDPTGKENLEYRVFDGAQWSEYMPLTIDLGNGYDCVLANCGCTCYGDVGDGSYSCHNWTTSGDLRVSNYQSQGASTSGKCLTVTTYLVEGNGEQTDCIRNSYGTCVSKSYATVTLCPNSSGGQWLVDFGVPGVTNGYMWGSCDYNVEDCGEENRYAIMGYNIPMEGGTDSEVIRCGFSSNQTCENYVWSQISSSDKAEINSNVHNTCTGVSL